MLYSQGNVEMSKELFENPTSEYRSAPFWAWNCSLDDELLKKQIGYLKEMGYGGFHIHSRTGLSTKYLSEEFFHFVKTCIKTAKEKHMLTWLYDEDRWPSGSAGGIVTKDEKYRARHLLFTPNEIVSEKANLIGSFLINLNQKGELEDYQKIDEVNGQKNVWHAYLELAEESAWYNNKTYVNTLDKKAIDKFCEVTHESYYNNVGEEFGNNINAIFTDEPQFTKKTTLGFAQEKKDIVLPWTDDFDATYQDKYGESILNKLPELIWNLPEERHSIARYHYHCHILDRFATAFADNLGLWCDQHHLKLTGHMMEEPTLESQTAALGEVMRSLSSFQIPGIDILCDRREFTTAKQAQSIAHQFNRVGVCSELYGVTNWDFDFRRHKLAGDWQAALGITLRVPHLSWVSMEGEAKRDYPATFNYQVPWYKEYHIIEDYFARINTAMTRGKAEVKIGVIHPVESYWLYWGPREQTNEIRKQLDENFKNITEWLLFGLLDFDFISEAVLEKLFIENGESDYVGAMRYEVIIVPQCKTVRATTVRFLERFQKRGGKVIYLGKQPSYIEVVNPFKIQDSTNSKTVIPFQKYEIIKALEDYRTVEIFDAKGNRTDNLLYQLRNELNESWLFIAHGLLPKGAEEGKSSAVDVVLDESIKIMIKGNWIPELYDAMSGKIHPIACTYVTGNTCINYSFYGYDSILIHLKPGKGAEQIEPVRSDESIRLGRLSVKKEDKKHFESIPVSVELSEPNVLVLDIAEYALDQEDYQEKEEILRLDNIVRKRLGYPERKNNVAQPWAIPEEKPEHILRLRYVFQNDIDLKDCYLALENAENTKIILNGTTISNSPCGYYVDEKISKIQLPELMSGQQTLELIMPFGLRTQTENCFILGEFGVDVHGSKAIIREKVKTLFYGDIVSMGLPFYGGNVVYHIDVTNSSNVIKVRVPQYRGALIGVEIDGKRAGTIITAPYECIIKNITKGKHRISLILFGNRVNTFGALHNSNENWWWFGPDAWRTFGDEFSYEYQLHKTGIMTAPEILLE